MSNSVSLTFGYKDTDFTRIYKLENVTNAALSSVKANIQAINASLTGGTAGGLSTFFVSDDGDAFTGIVAAQIDSTTTTNIALG